VLVMKQAVDKILIIAGLISYTAFANGQTEVPHEFQAGQPARAAEVNENFDTLEQAVQDLELNSSNTRTQVLSGFDISSEVRWLLADFFRRKGVWPANNAEAGAASAPNISSSHVVSVEIAPPLAGVIVITYGIDADISIAGAQMTIVATDNVGAIQFACDWDSELDPYVTDDDCVFVDEPPVLLSTVRKQVSSGIALASETRWLVADYYNHNGAFPDNNTEAGAVVPANISNSVVMSVEVLIGGEVRVTYGNDANINILGRTITFEPTVTSSGVDWSCNPSGLLYGWIIANDDFSSCVLEADKPPLPLTWIRGQIESGLPIAAIVQTTVESYFTANGIWPTSNADAGLSAPVTFLNASVASVGITPSGNGDILITYSTGAHPSLTGNTVLLTPTNNGGNISWECASSDIEQRYLPFGCKD